MELDSIGVDHNRFICLSAGIYIHYFFLCPRLCHAFFNSVTPYLRYYPSVVHAMNLLHSNYVRGTVVGCSATIAPRPLVRPR